MTHRTLALLALSTAALIACDDPDTEVNATSIAGLEQRLAAAEQSLASLSEGTVTPEDLAAATAELQTDIDANATAAADAAAAAATNATSLAETADALTAATGDIAANQLAIAANGTALAALDTELDGLSGEVTANAAAIAVNVADIDTNLGLIDANADDISSNAAAIAVNESTLDTHTTAIDANATDIATNADDLGALTDLLDEVETDVADNALAISVNTTAIDSNASDILDNLELIDDLDVYTTVHAATFVTNDNRDTGYVTGRSLTFTKSDPDSRLLIQYFDNLRTNASYGSCRWEVRIDGNNCTAPGGLYGDVHVYDSAGRQNDHKPHAISGLCTGTSAGSIGAGSHTISVYVSATPSGSTFNGSDCYTGWLSQRGLLTVQELPK